MFIVSLFDAARHAFAEWRRKQQAYAELMSLDDRSLADIGVRRSEIPAIVEGYHEASSKKSRQREFVAPFTTRKLAGGHTWFPWFPPL
ncbi:MAG TPA: DUF1127 domain-containing protein [Stellaceae bacterium]|nr:DUF1127 domain-containing protein [Stellaceae bacterium]